MSEKGVVIGAIAAFCVGHRGIGKDGGLPWPYLKEDVEFYQGTCKTTKDPNKKNGIIVGKHGWTHWEEKNKTHPKMVTVVTSSTLSKDGPDCFGVARSFDEAIEMFLNSSIVDQLENIYVLGGQKNYELFMTHPKCTKLVMTRVFQDFDSDTFFPEFEHLCHRVNDPEIDDKVREDPTTGIKFRFEIWEKNAA